MDVDGAEGPVFITGLDRSGKTRLRLLLGTHPDLHLVRRTALWTREGATDRELADEASLTRCLEWLRSGPRTAELLAEATGWSEEFERGPRTASRLFAAMYAARARANGKRRWGEQDAEVEQVVELCEKIQQEFPRTIFYLGQLVFEDDRFYYRLLHNETAFAIQRRLQFKGLRALVLPIRVLEKKRRLTRAS